MGIKSRWKSFSGHWSHIMSFCSQSPKRPWLLWRNKKRIHILKNYWPLDLQTNFWGEWVGLGFELRASHLQSRCSTSWTKPPVHFVLIILEMGSYKLCSWDGLKPSSILLISASQVRCEPLVPCLQTNFDGVCQPQVPNILTFCTSGELSIPTLQLPKSRKQG
jgi:hypothetical protein